MINQRYCPFCKTAAMKGCEHLALAVAGRDFVERCVELCDGQRLWQELCHHHRAQRDALRVWSPAQEDFTWLETAFCERFLQQLTWFGGMEHEWRSGPKPEQGAFWVLLWSKNPQRLWWQLREEFERQLVDEPKAQDSSRPLWPQAR